MTHEELREINAERALQRHEREEAEREKRDRLILECALREGGIEVDAPPRKPWWEKSKEPWWEKSLRRD